LKNFLIKIIKYRDWSIKFKLLVISIVLTFSSILLISFISYRQYTADFEKQSSERIQQTIDQVSLNLNTYLDDLLSLSISPYYNKDVMLAIESDNKGSKSEQLDKSRVIEDYLDEMMITPRKDIIRVFVFSLSDNVYVGSRLSTNIDTTVDYHKFDWYKEALNTSKPLFVPLHLEEIVENPKKTVFSIVSSLKSIHDTSSIVGVIKVDANYAGIQSICDKVNMGKKGRLFIIDDTQNIIYPENTTLSSLDSDSKNILSELSHNKTPYTVKYGNNSFLVNSAKISNSNWNIVSVNSVKELNSQATKTRNMSWFLAIIFSLSTTLIFALFYKRFLNPIMAIVKLMKEVENGNLSVQYKKVSNDEIGFLGSSFNLMISKVNKMFDENTKLVKEVYEYKLLQNQAQFNALYNQIKPHFIYNTLNMISLAILCGKYKQAVDSINKLSKLLRAITNIKNEITLEEELHILDLYLGIQSIRYNDSLEYSINIDSSLYSYCIPALLLQPIVENSIIHGCETKKGKTAIKIFNKYEDNFVVIYIQDNGSGIPMCKLSALKESILNFKEEDESKKGIGLANVNKRIKLKFGGIYGLNIESTPGSGTIVKICLPLKEIR